MIASKFGHAQVVRYLLQRGARVNKRNNLGWSALHWAAGENHANVVEVLLSDRRANVDIKTSDNLTPLYMTAYQGHLVRKLTCPKKMKGQKKNISFELIGCSQTSSGKRRIERQWTERAL